MYFAIALATLNTCSVDNHQQSLLFDSLAQLYPDTVQMEIGVHGTADHKPKVDEGRVYCLLSVSLGVCGHQAGNGVQEARGYGAKHNKTIILGHLVLFTDVCFPTLPATALIISNTQHRTNMKARSTSTA